MRLSRIHNKEPRARLGMVVSLCALLSLLVLAACETGATAQPSATTTSTLVAKPTIAATSAPTRRPAPAVFPPARGDGQLVYDAKTATLLLFGGDAYGSIGGLNDTWSWDGSTWTQLHPANAPTPRSAACIAYDAATGQVVLFGGISLLGNTPMLGDTWTWDGVNWTQQYPATSPALSFPNADNPISFSQSSMAYDNSSDRIMLILNGSDESTTGSDATRDHKFEATWTWDGRTWTLQDTAGPHEDGGVLIYDASLQSMIQFTVFLPPDSDTFEDKLWQWKGHAWEMRESWG